MHQTRQEVSKRIPIKRKGTKYVVRAMISPKESVPVLIAVRDMLKLARNKKEVEEMIKQKLLRINNRLVYDYHDSICLFNIFQADKTYFLSISPNGKFVLIETNNNSDRLCKVIKRTLVSRGFIQLNLHDGTNVLTKDKIKVSDTVYLDSENKIKKHVAFQEGKKCFIFSGKYAGSYGLIKSVENEKAKVILKDQEKIVEIKKQGAIVL